MKDWFSHIEEYKKGELGAEDFKLFIKAMEKINPPLINPGLIFREIKGQAKFIWPIGEIVLLSTLSFNQPYEFG